MIPIRSNLLPVLRDHARQILREVPKQTVVEWCEKNIVLSTRQTDAPGPFSTSRRAYMREPLNKAADTSVEIMVLCWGAQTAKTTVVMGTAAWAIDVDPCPMLWVMPSENLAKLFVKKRWKPMMEDTEVFKRHVTGRKFGVLFQDFGTCDLTWVGSNSPTNVSSHPIRRLYCDEVDKFADATSKESSALDNALQRAKSYGRSLSVITSTPTTENGSCWIWYQKGDQRRYLVPCPHCGKLIKLEWKQVKWDETAKNEKGEWVKKAVQASAYYECQECHGHINDAQKVAALPRGEWRAENTNPDPGVVSYHLSSLYSPDRKCTWGALAIRFLDAKKSLSGLQAFINSELAEPWQEDIHAISDFSFLEGRRGDYDFNQPWAEERNRFMAADKQAKGGEHYWWVIRAFGFGGSSRLVAYGKAFSYAELEEVRKAHGVKVDDAMIDSGFEAKGEAGVYRFCLGSGWKAFKGVAKISGFTVTDTKTGKAITTLWKKSTVDVGMGTEVQGRYKIPLFRFASDLVMDHLMQFMQGLAGNWTIPSTTDENYLKQVTAEVRREKKNPQGRMVAEWVQIRSDNHLLDCEKMILVAAIITKMIHSQDTHDAKP